MSVVLAVDPGRCTGWAYISTDRGLLACGIQQMEPLGEVEVDHPIYVPDRVIVELPQVYDAKHSKGNPNDLIPLAVEAGRVAEYHHITHSAKAEFVLPATWKGQVNKDVHHGRIWNKLSPKEQEIVSLAGRGMARSLVHNLMDAVGLALYAVRRAA